MSKAVAEQLFSRFIKLRDTDQYGRGFCIDTGKPIFHYMKDGKWCSSCENGHYISREIKSIMFNENNCHAQLTVANRSMVFTNYRENLIEKIGIEEVEWLESKKYEWGSKTYFELDYEAIAEEYRVKVDKLLKNKMF